MEFINLPILVLSLILVVSILTSLASSRMNIPLILVFLCIGLIVGDGGGLGIISGFHQPKIAFFIGSVALALILFDSGYQTNLKSYKKTAGPSMLLATVGVFFTALFLAPAARYILGFTWLESFLLASVISSTDAAAVFFLLRMSGISIRDKIKSTLEIESGSNDPMAIFLTFSFLSLMQAPEQTAVWFLIIHFILQMGIGAVAGVVMGWGIRWVINRIHFDTALYPVLVIGMVLTGFAATNLLNGSGFLALYIAGLVLGNSKLQGHHQILRFQTTLTWLCQIIMFLTLGLFAKFSELPALLLPSLALSFILIVFSRPLAVFLCLFPLKYTFLEKIFISFVGLRGATSILMALAPLVMFLPNAEMMFNLIFLMVLISLAIQGFFIPMMARLTRVILPQMERPPVKTELDLPGLVDSSLVTYKLIETTPVVQGAKVPRWATPILVKRGDMSYNGSNIKDFEVGDRVYVFAISEKREDELDWLYGGGQRSDLMENMGDFIISPDTKLSELCYLYGVPLPAKAPSDQTLRQVLEKNFSDMEVGDRFALGPVELVIRRKEEDAVSEVGLILAPRRKKPPFGRFFKLKKSFLK